MGVAGSWGVCLVGDWRDWRCFLFRTTTGEILTELTPRTGSWNTGLNEVSEGYATFDKSELHGVKREWLIGDYSSVAFTWNNAVVAGGVWRPELESERFIQGRFLGIRSVLRDRLVRENKRRDAKTIRFEHMSLGTIGQRVVRQALQRPGGELPIRMRVREEVYRTGPHERTYEPWNIANLSVDAVLDKLSNVKNGPDFVFALNWAIEGESFVWDMWNSREGTNQIQHSHVPLFDLSAPASEFTQVHVRCDYAPVDRVFSVGAGEGKAVKMGYHEDLWRVKRGFPFRERTIQRTDQTNHAVLDAHAEGEWDSRNRVIVQPQVHVDGSRGGQYGRDWHVGWACRLHLPGMFVVPEWCEGKVMRVSGEYGSQVLQVEVHVRDVVA